MKAFGRAVVKSRFVILVVALILLIPSAIAYKATKVNYNLIHYLPSQTETIKAQKILEKDFGFGDYALVITENMNAKQILDMEEDIRKIDGVGKVGSAYDLVGYSLPLEILPRDLVGKVNKDQSNLMVILLSSGISSDQSNKAINKIREIGDSFKLQGMTALNLDNAQLADSEVPIYVVVAAILCYLVMALSLDSYIIPLLILGNIGMSIIYNMGTNLFLGQISYITKAIAAVLQLGVTLDFSIFLYHKYEGLRDSGTYERKEDAMADAIAETMVSVIGSSLTTIAGFLALCTMQLTLGVDIGVVMAKGVAFGVVSVSTVLPALILFFDKYIEKTRHKVLLPHFTFMKKAVSKAHLILAMVFVIAMVPAYYGQSHTKSYYNLTSALPQTLPSIVAKKELKDKFNLISPYILLVDSHMSSADMSDMIDDIENVEGIDFSLSSARLQKIGFSLDMVSNDIKKNLDNGTYQMVLVNSIYDTATDELNAQIAKVNKIVKSYDSKALLCGEGPLMKDMVQVADHDFQSVNTTSIAVILAIMILVLRSISLPIILIAAIELAIFINMGIPFYTGVEIPFVASIVIGTIQLGATIDYAILMSTKYLELRKEGHSKKESILTAVDSSVNSIFVSAMCFFGATIGVSIISKMDMISSICTLISRGALISMMVVGFIVPSLIWVFDPLIIRSSLGFKKLKEHHYKDIVKES